MIRSELLARICLSLRSGFDVNNTSLRIGCYCALEARAITISLLWTQSLLNHKSNNVW